MHERDSEILARSNYCLRQFCFNNFITKTTIKLPHGYRPSIRTKWLPIIYYLISRSSPISFHSNLSRKPDVFSYLRNRIYAQASEVQALTLLTHTHAICMRLSASAGETASPPAFCTKAGARGADHGGGQRSRCDKLWYSAVSVAGWRKMSSRATRAARARCDRGGRRVHIWRSPWGGRSQQYIRVGIEWRVASGRPRRVGETFTVGPLADDAAVTALGKFKTGH